MTIDKLLSVLSVAQAIIGGEAQVLLLDDKGEWEFSVHIERELLNPERRPILYFDSTGDADDVSLSIPPIDDGLSLADD